ncbi:AmmeMemoRadiSam system protein B [Thermophagus xiamenensis]|jgi:hypothetical protein|uniref:MEMO1 family protein SAMN05444380_10855 n=1 Tax=Thermophagus xiamenensis TaxID=385682 RepID=A0A1I1YMR1_9BACT|nr:AmmeMemoRadiSam system protein B [Thermophagus xiamenensis]SFE20885.1 hypothetical protein SAMN05444380_10855 [Thermophagus xiamenensis]
MEVKDRQPSVAGMFYAGEPVALQNHLKSLFEEAQPGVGDAQVAALIVPHAGYLYSGGVAASGFAQINENAHYKTIFLIGSSHRMAFNGASVYTQGDYLTPLGRVDVDKALAQKLVESSPYITDIFAPHKDEHSLEVELPFLQYRLKNSFKLVPIVMGPHDAVGARMVAEALKPYFKPGNLFVISTDFSHYPKYEDAKKVDAITVDAILKNDPDLLLNTLEQNRKLGVTNLVTSLCGWTSVLTLLYITQDDTCLDFRHIEYRNSGDVPFGDSSRVVGYHAIAVFRKKESKTTAHNCFSLNDQEKQWLLNRARKTLEAVVRYQQPEAPSEALSVALKTPAGAFVSLYKNEQLRGCIGNLSTSLPLWKVVERMTAAAAFNDSRFTPVKEEELGEIKIEISLLTPLQMINDISEIIPGRHGIVIEKDGKSGTFLPQVAIKTGWGREELLGHCARDKAGIGWEGWRDANIYIYEALVFGE